MSDIIITQSKKFSLNCQFETVSIEIDCGDIYEAQSLFDELEARLKHGEPITLRPKRSEP